MTGVLCTALLAPLLVVPGIAAGVEFSRAAAVSIDAADWARHTEQAAPSAPRWVHHALGLRANEALERAMWRHAIARHWSDVAAGRVPPDTPPPPMPPCPPADHDSAAPGGVGPRVTVGADEGGYAA